MIRPFFLITWFTDPPTRFCRILKKEKKLNDIFIFIFIFYFLFFFFTIFQLSVTSPDKGGGQINYGVQGTQELEPTDIAREETRHGGPYDLLIVLSNNDCSRAEA